MRRRSRIGIIVEILSELEREGEMPASRLATYVNMPYDRLRPLLEQLEERGYLASRREGRSAFYRLTAEGQAALSKLREAYELLRSMGVA